MGVRSGLEWRASPSTDVHTRPHKSTANGSQLGSQRSEPEPQVVSRLHFQILTSQRIMPDLGGTKCAITLRGCGVLGAERSRRSRPFSCGVRLDPPADASAGWDLAEVRHRSADSQVYWTYGAGPLCANPSKDDDEPAAAN